MFFYTVACLQQACILQPLEVLGSDPAVGRLNEGLKLGSTGRPLTLALMALQAMGHCCSGERGSKSTRRGAATTRLARNRLRTPLPRSSTRTGVSLGGPGGWGLTVISLSCSPREAICLPACSSPFCLTVHPQCPQLCKPRALGWLW